jgi:hypothetical protein
MRRFALYIVAASFLATPLLVHAGDTPTPLKAVAQIKGLQPLADQTLAQIRGQGWEDVVAAAVAGCSGSCNVQHVSQFSSDPNSSNVVVIRQSN